MKRESADAIDLSNPCAHVTADLKKHVHRPAKGCEECLAMGSTWVHLRVCLSCGHVGCCDASQHRHATAHYRSTQHPVISSGEAGETWAYCYPDDQFLSAE
jgi:uncharacterized UBP type Zn finger protein